MKMNCWEFHKCGRESEGKKVAEFGICPASESKKHHGKNMGVNGGRYCWKISGTLCEISTKGSKPKRILKCVECEFYKLVQDEQGSCIEM